jgi:SAM-dependent methyltransferase
MLVPDEIADANRRHWEQAAQEREGATVPWLDLDREVLRRYASGAPVPVAVEESLRGDYPAHVLAEGAGKDVLCLANGGGQQSAVFGLLGARVTVVDLTEGQLAGDRTAAAHYGYEVAALRADMRDLSCLPDASFDLVFQGPSMAWVPDAREVYRGVARVLRPAGLYRVHFTNPAVEFAHESWDGEGYRITRPYAEKVRHTPGEGYEFRHPLEEIFNGLIELGLTICRVEEDPYSLPDGTTVPGSWDHSGFYLVGFWVEARKG